MESKDGICIQGYETKDRENVEKISWQVQKWEKSSYPGKAVSKEIIARHVDRLLEQTGGGRGALLVAIADKICVGYAAGCLHQDFLNADDAFYVKDMGVDEAHRRKGIGTALLSEMERIAKEKFHVTKMMIAVICGNDGAEALHKRLGFVPYELELIKSI